MMLGYCQTEQQEKVLLCIGLDPRFIWREGRGSETLAECLACCRARPAVLVLGVAVVKSFTMAGITVVGLPMADYDELIELLSALAGARYLRRVCKTL